MELQFALAFDCVTWINQEREQARTVLASELS